MNELKEKQQEILLQCEYISKLGNQIVSGQPHPIVNSIAHHIMEQVSQIGEICSVDKYNLSFNGKVGIGKSTVICMITNLLNTQKLKEGIRFTEIPLLKTGSGRITLCKTRIIFHAEESKIEIEPISLEEYETLLEELKMVFDNKYRNTENSISVEEKKCLLSMAGCNGLTEVEIWEKLGQDKNVSELMEAIKARIDYENRRQTTYFCEGNFLEWLSHTYTAINDGKQEQAPIPKEIRIYINEEDFEAEVPEYISEIIDTRGLDGGERQDIQDTLKTVNYLSVFCDEINGYGGDDIIKVLKPGLIKEDRFKRYRVQLLGIEKNGELSNVLDNREKAQKIKREEAERKLASNGIHFYHGNYQFFSSLDGIELSNNKHKVIEFDFDKIKQSRQTFWKNICTMLWNMYCDLQNCLSQYSQQMNLLSQGKISEEIENKIKSCQQSFSNIYCREEKGKIEYIEKLQEKTKDILDGLGAKVVTANASKLGASVRRNGYGNLNLYSEFYDCGGEQFEKDYRNAKTEIMTIIAERLNGEEDIESICKQILLEKVEELFRVGFDEQQRFYEHITKWIWNQEDWEKPKQFWGDKKGEYRQRVWKEILAVMEKRGVIKTLGEKEMEMKFLAEVIKLFNIK